MIPILGNKIASTGNFVELVLEPSLKKPVLVAFIVKGNDSCNRLLHSLQQVGGKFVAVDVETEKDLVMQFGLQTVPTVLLFKNKRPVDGFSGIMPPGQIKLWLSKHFAVNSQDLEAGKAAFKHGDLVKAELHFRNAAANQWLVLCYLAQGRIEEARNLYKSKPLDEIKQLMQLVEKGLAADAASSNYQDKALFYYARGEYQKSFDVLLQQINVNVDAKELLVQLINALGNEHPIGLAGRRRLASAVFG